MKLNPAIIFSILFLTLVSFRISAQTKPELEVGIGIVDISGDSAIILDPLHVKVVVFRQGAVQFALVECEIAVIQSNISQAAREKASKKTGIAYTNICVAATHTQMFQPHKDIESAVVEAVLKAQAAFQLVTMKTALGQEFNVSFNRRYFMKDGSVVFNPMFLNPDIVRPVGPIPRISIPIPGCHGPAPKLCRSRSGLGKAIVKN